MLYQAMASSALHLFSDRRLVNLCISADSADELIALYTLSAMKRDDDLSTDKR